MAALIPQKVPVDNREKMMYGFAAMFQNLPVLEFKEEGVSDQVSEYSYVPERKPKGVFIATAVMLFFLSLSAADSIGFVPYYVDGTAPHSSGTNIPPTEDALALSHLPQLGEEQRVSEVIEVPVAIKPERIVITSIGLDLPIQNPETRDIAALDEVLKDGPARYVDSALLGQKGNMLVFAHSSRLPVVRNQMYKAFNRVSELESGDTITVSGDGKEYIYSVTSVRRADAEEELIDLAPTGNRLTLVTCDTLTSKTSRFIVEAELVGEF
jgi:LPXTG-site transpeptidase (sortase) family protein